MNIIITGHDITITDALRSFTEEKIEKIKNHFDKLTDIHVIISLEKTQYIAEATTNFAKVDLHTKAIEPSAYAAIDVLIDKLHRQVLKQKEKMISHRDHHD